MATITKTYTENQGTTTYRSSWTIVITGTDTSSNNAGNFVIPVPSATAKFVQSQKNNAQAYLDCCFDTTNAETDFYYNKFGGMVSGSTYDCPKSKTSVTIPVSNYFSSSNPTTSEVLLPIIVKRISLHTWSQIGVTQYDSKYESNTVTNYGTVLKLKYAEKPTFNASELSKDTSVYVAGLTTVSVTVSNATAYYGGTISSAKLAVGTQEATISGNGTISMTLQNTGTFTPAVTVTDSRGQTATQNLEPITVLQYENPTTTFDIFRCGTTGIKNDEGHNGLITATFTYMDAVSSLAEPEIQINGYDISQTVGASITWYTALTQTGAVDTTTEIDDWGDIASGATVYGLLDGNYDVTGNFSEGESYLIGLIAKDSRSKTSALITQTLSTAFYTIDFQAGGKEVAFGAPANDDLTNIDGIDCSDKGLFKCNMDAMFRDKNDVVRLLFDYIYPVGSYYETSKSQAEFDPNDVWGGTWVLETSGQVHVSSGTGYSITHANDNNGAGASDGGSPYIQAHIHGFTNPTIASSGAHTHTVTVRYRTGALASGSAQSQPYANAGNTSNNIAYTPSGGGAHGHSYSANGSVGAVSGATTGQGGNMMPYIVVNRWHRTA